MRVISIIASVLIFALVVQSQESQGAPGVDYPNYVSIPKTSFSCAEQKYIPGFYADVESQCQVFHYCLKNRKETFLCPPKFIFNQAILGCDFWYNSNCSLAPLLYSKNSGSLLETARRKLPLLIKLRNRSLSKSFAQPAADVYEKITSLYESSTDVTQSVTEPVSSNDYAEMGSEPEAEPKSEAEPLEIKNLEIDSPAQDLSSSLDVDEPNEESEEEAYFKNLGETGENLKGGIFYDPVTEQYYINYDSSQDEWQQDSEGSVEELYDYGSLPDNYNLGLPDYDERSINTESEFSTEQIIGFDWDKRQEAEKEQFLRRALSTKQFPKRLRRKPLYTVIPDEEYHADGKEYPNLDVDTGSLSADDDTLQVSRESEVSVSFPQNDSDTAPHESELELLASSESRNDDGELQNVDIATTLEEEQESSDDIVIYNDQDLSQGDLESNPEESDDGIIIVEEPDSGVEFEKSEEDVNWSAGESKVAADSDVDDTLIVIPDELDAAGSSRMLQTDENIISEDETADEAVREEQDESQSDAAYNYEAMREYCILNCGCSNVYPSMDSPFQDYRMYYPDEIQGQKQFSHEGYPGVGSPYAYTDTAYADDNFASSHPESLGYGFASSKDPSAGEPGSEEYERPMSSAGYMYGSSDGYYDQFYNNAYMNQYAQNMAYAGAESEVSGYPQTSSETSNEAVTYDYSESGGLSVQDALSGKPEIENVHLSNRSPLQPDKLALNEKLEDGSLGGQRGMKNDETFYVFDFDEDSVKPAVELAGQTSDTITGQAALEESFHPWQSNESLDGEVKSNLNNNKASDTYAVESGFPVSEYSGEGTDHTKSGSSAYVADAKSEFTGTLSADGKNDPQKPITLTPSAEQLGDLSSQSLPWASDVNKYLSQDKYLQSMGFHEPMDFGPYGIAGTAGQQQSSANSFSTKDFNSFSQRTGNAGIPKLSVIQDRIRSLKQGKFGAFKKYMNTAGSKN